MISFLQKFPAQYLSYEGEVWVVLVEFAVWSTLVTAVLYAISCNTELWYSIDVDSSQNLKVIYLFIHLFTYLFIHSFMSVKQLCMQRVNELLTHQGQMMHKSISQLEQHWFR